MDQHSSTILLEKSLNPPSKVSIDSYLNSMGMGNSLETKLVRDDKHVDQATHGFLSSFSSSHKETKGHHLTQNLTVKVYNNLEGKSNSAASGEQTPASSLSTSAGSPDTIESAQPRNRRSIFAESTLNDEEVFNLNVSRESTEVSSNIQPQQNDATRPINSNLDNNNSSSAVSVQDSTSQANSQRFSLPSTFHAQPSNTISSNNQAQASNTQAPHSQAPETQLIDSLEFVFEKTPIITIFMSLICTALLSGIGVSILEGRDSYSFLFIVVYIFLLYLLIVRIFKMCRSTGFRNLNILGLIRSEPFFELLDIATFMTVAVIIHLKVIEYLKSLNIAMCLLVQVFALYGGCSRAPIKTRLWGIAKRAFYFYQPAVIVLKLHDKLPSSWNMVLFFGWVLLGSLLFRLLKTTIQILDGFSRNAMLRCMNRGSKTVGVVGIIFLAVDLVFLMMALLGLCKMLEAEDPEGENLKFWLTILQYLNASLLFFTTITGTDLSEFVLCTAEYFSGLQKDAGTQKKQLVCNRRETYVTRLSPTYYKVVEKPKTTVSSARAQEEGDERNEDNTCYICCGKSADGVILDCGHGGICHGCLIDYINSKDACMECRKKVNTVLKIATKVNGNTYKGEEITRIVRK